MTRTSNQATEFFLQPAPADLVKDPLDPPRHPRVLEFSFQQQGHGRVPDLDQLVADGLGDPIVVIGQQPDQRFDLIFTRRDHQSIALVSRLLRHCVCRDPSIQLRVALSLSKGERRATR